MEEKIQEKLEEIEAEHGVGYARGRSWIIETDSDFAVPSVEDPWVIIVSSFQETTSSGQTTKARPCYLPMSGFPASIVVIAKIGHS